MSKHLASDTMLSDTYDYVLLPHINISETILLIKIDGKEKEINERVTHEASHITIIL